MTAEEVGDEVERRRVSGDRGYWSKGSLARLRGPLEEDVPRWYKTWLGENVTNQINTISSSSDSILRSRHTSPYMIP